MKPARSRLRGLSLRGFKGFETADAKLGDFTIIVGTNASGKSNLRDALRFLHGISRGYSLAETIGEKWIDGGVLQWRGLRGGIREISFDQAPKFQIGVEIEIDDEAGIQNFAYEISVQLSHDGRASIAQEKLEVGHQRKLVFTTAEGTLTSLDLSLPQTLSVSSPEAGRANLYPRAWPVLPSLAADPSFLPPALRDICRQTLDALSSIRFLDLEAEAMRIPSLPGQLVLGDRGENLSSVLLDICASPARRDALVGWVRALTPLDVTDFDFVADQTGKVLVTLVEAGGRRTSAHSASDGTLRFLALVAAFLGSDPARLYFFEELETGLHPTRLHLLLQLIERESRNGGSQVLASTHSPQLLTYLAKETLADVLLTYRKEGDLSQHVARLLDLPHAREVLESQDISRLHGSGWLEDAIAFAEDPASP